MGVFWKIQMQVLQNDTSLLPHFDPITFYFSSSNNDHGMSKVPGPWDWWNQATLQTSPEESSATWLPWNLSESWEEKRSSQCWKYLIPESQSEIQVHLEEHDTVINALHCVSCIHKPQSRSRYSLCSGSSTSSIQFPVWQGGESWVSAVNLSLAADKNILYLSCLLSRLERQTNWQTY